MKTDDLISHLSADLKPVSSHAAIARMALGLGSGLLLSCILMIVLLGPRADLVAASGAAAFWVKLAYTLALSVGGVVAANRMGYPLGSSWPGIVIVALAVLVVILLALVQLASTPADEYKTLLFGRTVTVCSLNITFLSLPLLLSILWFFRGMAPVHPTRAGAVAGLAAGALASAIYSFHCNESAMPFIAIWYTLGAVCAGAIGALAGRFTIRW